MATIKQKQTAANKILKINYPTYGIKRREVFSEALFRDEALPTAREREEWAKICDAPIKTRYFILNDGNYKSEFYAANDAEASKLFNSIN